MAKRILFTCGGTAGHINPALALAGMFRDRMADAEILFVGADGGMECVLVPREGYSLRTVTISSFQRSISPSGLSHNLKTIRNLALSRRQAAKILDEFPADLAVGTGGYASYPVMREAARRGIPTAVHESNAQPGLTTKMLAKHVSRVMVGFPESREHYPHPERVRVTGTPVRRDFFALSRAEARQRLGLTDSRPLVLSYWGSLGALVMNREMVDFMDAARRDNQPFYHLHGAGKRYYAELTAALQGRGIHFDGSTGAEVREYIYDMPTAMAAADLLICRAGASTISEVTALHKPAVLVPSPNVTANHQEKNARVLADRGAAVLLREDDCGGGALYRTVRELLGSRLRLEQMTQALSELDTGDPNEEIFAALLELLA